jgi:hypothetical protein
MKIFKIMLLLAFMTLLINGEDNRTETTPIVPIVSTTNVELEVVSKLSEFMGTSLNGFTNQILILLSVFGFMVTLVSLLGYLKLKNLSDNIERNRELITEYKEYIDNKFTDYRKEMKQEIVEEVKQQIVYGLDGAILKVQEHAYRKVEYTVDNLTNEIQQRRFFYQGLIFKINQVKKYEYEDIMKQEIDVEEKISKIIVIQSKYNEINNHDIPKLFSKKVEENVVPSAKKLSEYGELKHIVSKLLLKALENDKLNYVEQTQIQDVLKEYYDWDEKIELKN